MKKINVYLDEVTLSELKKIPGTISEHIREAVSRYLKDYQNGSTSKSVTFYIGKGDDYAESSN